LVIDQHDIEDIIRLVGDWPTTQSTLEKLDACGVKVASIRALQQKLQRVLSYGFYSSSQDRKALMAYFRSPANTVFTIKEKQFLTEAECDRLLLVSHGKGVNYLLQTRFPRIAAAHPTKTSSLTKLIERITLQQAKEAQEAHEAAAKQAPSTSHVAVVDTPGQDEQKSSLLPVDPQHTAQVVAYLGSPDCTLFSESLENVGVRTEEVEALIRECESRNEKDTFDVKKVGELQEDEKTNITLYFLRYMVRIFYKARTLVEVQQTIRTGKETGSFLSQATVDQIQSYFGASPVLLTSVPLPKGAENDQLIIACDGLLGIQSELEALVKQGKTFSSVKELIQYITTAPKASAQKTLSPVDRQALSHLLLHSNEAGDSSSGLSSSKKPLLPEHQIETITDDMYMSWIQECFSLEATLQRLALFASVDRHFTSASDILPALVELSRSGLAVSPEVRQSLVDHLLDERTHVFRRVEDKDHAHVKAVVSSATGSEITSLFVEGEGLANLLHRVTYLDIIGERYTSFTELRNALSQLRGLIAPSEKDRAALVDYFSDDTCRLFEMTEEDLTLEITSNELDAIIVHEGGLEPCLKSIRALEDQGWKLQNLTQLLLLLLGKPADGAIQQKSTAEQAAAKLTAFAAANGGAGHSPSASSAGSSTTTTTTTTAAVHPPLTEDEMNEAHGLIIEFLSREDINLFSPLAETGAELEISDIELDALIKSTDGDVQKSLKILTVLDSRREGFHTLQQLAGAVEAEFKRHHEADI
jgi:hypothetical protein